MHQLIEFCCETFGLNGAAVAGQKKSDVFAILQRCDCCFSDVIGEQKALPSFKAISFAAQGLPIDLKFDQGAISFTLIMGHSNGMHIQINMKLFLHVEKFHVDPPDSVLRNIT